MFEIFVTGLMFIFVTKLANFAEPCKKPVTEALGKRYGTAPYHLVLPRTFHLFTGVKSFRHRRTVPW